MWVYSICPPSLSLIGELTMDIHYQTETKNWKYNAIKAKMVFSGIISSTYLQIIMTKKIELR